MRVEIMIMHNSLVLKSIIFGTVLITDYNQPHDDSSYPRVHLFEPNSPTRWESIIEF